MTFLYKTIVEKFGPIFEAEVPFVKKQGKAILVSGSSFLDLERILIAVKGLNINVYTHHDMLSAFQYKKLSQYPNLVGHYQNSNTNFPLDFASFPGPIYISRNSIPKIDAIRGQIYTSAKYPSYGIAKISNDDFSPLITYALKSKGFSNDEFINKIKIGFSSEEIDKNIEKISNKFQNNEIKHIFIIGLLDHFNKSNQYINEFLTNCPENAYIISFSYFKERNNFWHVNSYYDFSILYSIVEKLKILIKDVENDISVILTDCNSSTISHIFNLKHLKIKNIFLGPCCPNIINPVLIEGLSDLFEVKPLTKAIDDINSVLL
jgi:hydroxylamine reductase